jgi:streptogramin lyase
MTVRTDRGIGGLSLIVMLALSSCSTTGAAPGAPSTAPVRPSSSVPSVSAAPKAPLMDEPHVQPLQPNDTIHVSFPQDLALAGDAIWTVNEFIGAVTKIDPARGTADIIRLPKGVGPQGLEATDDTVWVAGQRGLVRIDASTGEVAVTHSALSINGGGLTIAAGSLWVVAGDLWRLDPETGATISKLDEPDGATCSSVSAGPHGVWWACDDAVYRVDPSTGRVEGKLRRGGGVIDTPDGTWLSTGDDIFAAADEADAYTELTRFDPTTLRLASDSEVLVRGAASGYPLVEASTVWFPVSAGVGDRVGRIYRFDAARGLIDRAWDASEGRGYGQNAVLFAYGSLWTVSGPAERVRRFVWPPTSGG